VVIYGLVVALVPSPDRERIARSHELDAPRWSFGLGLAQMGVGMALFLVLGLSFMRGATTEGSVSLIENWFPGLSTTHFQSLGLMNWLAWLVLPFSWPFSYVALIGLVRCVAFVATREAVAEPIVWTAVMLSRRLADRRRDRIRSAELGPLRPDRVLPVKDGVLIVLTCREKAEWTDTVTVEVSGRYYRVSGPEDRADGDWTVLCYTLRPQARGAIIRRLVRYKAAPRVGGARSH
jgi:hypothetical protein